MDCDDLNNLIHPQAVEECDNDIDENCDGYEAYTPSVDNIVVPLAPVSVGVAIQAQAFFSDLNKNDTLDVSWDWGDGNDPVLLSLGPGETVSRDVSLDHQYVNAGVYNISVTVSDPSSCNDYTLSSQYIVAYDPGAGFVTGGGWINSPAGAYTDTSLIGKANFGFVSKYKKGATVPTGETEFQFKAGGLNFHSENYEWLVIAGARAQFKGDGTINGGGNYGFLLTAIDGKIAGGGSIDKFRIKIWNKNAGDGIIYDNMHGESDDVDPTSVIGGGSIVIHD